MTSNDCVVVLDDQFLKTIIYSSFISHDELVVVERPWVKVNESLPETLYRVKYAT